MGAGRSDYQAAAAQGKAEGTGQLGSEAATAF